jgi:hypothetical protein
LAAANFTSTDQEDSYQQTKRDLHWRADPLLIEGILQKKADRQ